MPRKTTKDKVQFLYTLTEMINRVSVKAERKGAGEVGGDVLEIADFAAAFLGLSLSYKERLYEFTLCNGGIQEAMEEFVEEERI